MEKNPFDNLNNEFFNIDCNFNNSPAGRSFKCADLPRESLGILPNNVLACDSFTADFGSYRDSLGILDINALDLGRDSIAIYNINKSQGKSSQHKDFQKDSALVLLEENYSEQRLQVPSVLPQKSKSLDDAFKFQGEDKLSTISGNCLDGSKFTSAGSPNIFNDAFMTSLQANISYLSCKTTKSSIAKLSEDLENVRNSVQLQRRFDELVWFDDLDVADLDGSVFLSEKLPSSNSGDANTSRNTSDRPFDKVRYLLDSTPQPDFDELDLSKGSDDLQKPYLVGNEAVPKIIDKMLNMQPVKLQQGINYSETASSLRPNVSQTSKSCQCDILKGSDNELNLGSIYSEDDIKKCIKTLSDALNKKESLSKSTLDKSHKILDELENTLIGPGETPTRKKSVNDLDKERNGAKCRSSSVASLSTIKTSIGGKKIGKQVNSTVTKKGPLRATLPVEAMSKKGICQPATRVPPVKSVESNTKTSKATTPLQKKSVPTATSTPLSRLPKIANPFFYSPPAKNPVLNSSNGTRIKRISSPLTKPERPVLLKTKSFEGPMSSAKSGISTITLFRKAGKENLKPCN